MAKIKDKSKAIGNVVTIDFDVWCTQAQLAEFTGTKLATISTKVKRSLAGIATENTRVDTLRIDHLNITLVKRP